MAGGIKKVDIVEADLNQLSEEIRKVGTEMGILWDVLSKKPQITGLTDFNKAAKETSDSSEKLTLSQIELAKLQKQVEVLTARMAKEYQDLNKEKQQLIALQSAENANAKEEITEKKKLLSIKEEEKRISKEIADQKKFELEARRASIKAAFDEEAAIKKSNNATQSSVKLTNEQKLALQLANKEEKLRITIANSAEGSYDRLNAQYQLNIISLQKMSEAERTSGARAKELVSENATLVGKLNALDQQSGRTKRSFNGLQWQVTQLARELPALAYGVNVFFGAIGNNLPMLIDEIKTLSAANKIAAEQGRATVPIWKQMASVIFNWQTAIIVALTALTLYGKEVVNFVGSLFKFNSAMRLSNEEVKSMNETISKTAGTELGKLDSLFNKLKNAAEGTKEYSDTKKEIIDNYGKYISGLDSETISLNNITRSYREIRLAILEKIKAQALDNVYVDQSTKLLASTNDNYEMIRKSMGARYGADMGDQMFEKFRAEFEETGRMSDEMKKIFEELEPKKATSFAAQGTAMQINTDFSNSPMDIYNNIIRAQEKYNAKIKDAEKIMGPLFTSTNKINSSLVEELELKLSSAKLLPETTKEEIKAKNITIKGIEDEIKALRELGIEKEKKAKKDKNPMSTKDFKYDIQADEEKDQRDLNAMILKAEKELTKELTDERKERTRNVISDSVALADEEKLSAQEIALEDIKAAKNNKDEIAKIQHELTMFMINEDMAAQQRILDTAFLEPDAYEKASNRLRLLRLQRGEEEISFAEKTEAEKAQIRDETMRATHELLSQGLSFSQQIYSAQAESARHTYDSEMEAAGENLEYQTLAKRKFEAEDKKIKRRQAIASKMQAVLDAGLALALAIATTWKNPFLAAINIAAASLGLGMALATPIPQFEHGTDNAPDTFIAGDKKGEEGATELIKLRSGKKILTPARPTLFSGSEFKGSTVFPNTHIQTQRMLASMSFSQARDTIDLRKTNTHLSGIERNTKAKSSTYIDKMGRLVVRRGSVNSTL